MLSFCKGLLENQKQTTRPELENFAKARLYYRVRTQTDIYEFLPMNQLLISKK